MRMIPSRPERSTGQDVHPSFGWGSFRRWYNPAMPSPQLENLEIQFQSLEERPDPSRLAFCKEQLRAAADVHAISGNVYSEMLMRLRRVRNQLEGGE